MGNETEHVVACGAHVFGSEVGKRLVFGTHITSSDARKATRFALLTPFAPRLSTQANAHTAESSPKTYTTAFH